MRLMMDDGHLAIEVMSEEISTEHKSQLAFWGFQFNLETGRFLSRAPATGEFAAKILAYFATNRLQLSQDEGVRILLDATERSHDELVQARQVGADLKNGAALPASATDFRNFLRTQIPRRLKNHQEKAALHLLGVENAANFSVPGSGKTTVVLTVFEYLRRILNAVDALFVVGPTGCFTPWRTEYRAVLGREPDYDLFAGGDVSERRSRYHITRESVGDLYLTSFQTLQRDFEQVRTLFRHQGVGFFLVIDEAHYIKQLGGAWASAALAVSQHAVRRCVLSGTPFPHSYADAFNLFDALWPDTPALSDEQKTAINVCVDQRNYAEARRILDGTIGPLFYRVRKSELGLAAQRFHEPVIVRMRPYEERLYEAIVGRIASLSEHEYAANAETLVQLHRGRIMRLRQCVSYVRLLRTAIKGYKEDLIGSDVTLRQIIEDYDNLERPGKLDALCKLVKELTAAGEKVVVWSNFVETLKLIQREIAEGGIGVDLIYGMTPFHTDVADGMTRDRIIQRFLNPSSRVDVLVANPAACAEAISLHKTCSHAIYYDMSYNCAQYLQSLDRIHRVGGSEVKEAHYHFVQYDGTLDQDVLDNVLAKARAMSAIIDREYPIYSLNMFEDDDQGGTEIDAYKRHFG